jgi:hypothetical protein
VAAVVVVVVVTAAAAAAAAAVAVAAVVAVVAVAVAVAVAAPNVTALLAPGIEMETAEACKLLPPVPVQRLVPAQTPVLRVRMSTELVRNLSTHIQIQIRI